MKKLLPYFKDACMFIQHSVQPSYGDAEGTPNTILEASAAALTYCIYKTCKVSLKLLLIA